MIARALPLWLVPFWLALSLSACGQLPQPFSKDEANLALAPFLIPRAAEGVIVWPMVGVDDATGDLIASMTVDALHKRGVAASTRTSNRASLILTTAGNRLPGGALEVTWTLSRPDGAIVGTRVDAIADDDRFDQAVAAVAQWIVPTPVPVEQKADPLSIAVFDVEGAPGNGNDLLRRAMGFALERADVGVTGFPPPDGFVVQGDVSMERQKDGKGDLVTVSWVVMDANGNEIGTIDQANTVPPGYLDRNWGPVAAPIADAAADGILELVKRHKEVQAQR